MPPTAGLFNFGADTMDALETNLLCPRNFERALKRCLIRASLCERPPDVVHLTHFVSCRLVNVKDAPETHPLSIHCALYCALENFVDQPVRTRASIRLLILLNAIIHRFFRIWMRKYCKPLLINFSLGIQAVDAVKEGDVTTTD
jgi:hypothetical protein